MDIIDANTLFGFWPFRRVDMTPQSLFRQMKKHGIKKACTMSAKGIFYDFAQGNEETFQAFQANDWMIPVGTIDLRKFVGYEEEIRKRKEQGFRLFRFFPDYQGWSIESAVFKRILKALNELRIPLMISMKTVEMTKLAAATRDFEAPIILESLHYYKTAEALAVIEDSPNTYVETHWLHGPDSIEIFVDKIGAEHLIFGSCAPLLYIAPALNCIRYAEITNGQKELILSKNLLRVVVER